MLRRDSGKSISFCDGFRKQNLFRTGAGLLPLLAVMLLAGAATGVRPERSPRDGQSEITGYRQKGPQGLSERPVRTTRSC